MIIKRIPTSYLQKCHACGRVGHNMYAATVNGNSYIVCSSDHAVKLEEEANKDTNGLTE